MPQAVIIQPSAPRQTPTADSTSNKKQGEKFAPHLENAISDSKNQQQTAADNRENIEKKSSATTEESALTEHPSQSIDSQDPVNNLVPDPTTTTHTSKQNILSSIYTETTQPGSSSSTSQTRNVESQINQPVGTSIEINPELNASAKAPGSYDILSELPPARTAPKVLDQTQPVAATKQDAIINQLEQIIENANETGTVSIRKTANSSTLHSITNSLHGVTPTSSANNLEPIVATANTETSALNIKGLLGQGASVIDQAANKPTQQQTELRTENQQQQFSAKINTQNLSENNQNFQGNKGGDEFPQQSSGFNSSSGPVSNGEQTNTFSQISTIAQEVNTQTVNESAKPIMLPSGTIVYEDEIINQFSQRIQIAKQMDSRINLKLHPAELGELKIDISLKEGSIRANVVAQSQHTLEILEKNIPKLKTILENQGFTVDEISVTNESESVGEFDLFDQQLFNQNDYTPTAQQGNREEEAIFTLDDAELVTQAGSTGVNVKI